MNAEKTRKSQNAFSKYNRLADVFKEKYAPKS
jgi:hypothetical protein